MNVLYTQLTRSVLFQKVVGYLDGIVKLFYCWIVLLFDGHITRVVMETIFLDLSHKSLTLFSAAVNSWALARLSTAMARKTLRRV